MSWKWVVKEKRKGNERDGFCFGNEKVPQKNEKRRATEEDTLRICWWELLTLNAICVQACNFQD